MPFHNVWAFSHSILNNKKASPCVSMNSLRSVCNGMKFVSWYSTKKKKENVTKHFQQKEYGCIIGYVGDGGAEKATEDGEPVQRASYHHLFHQAWLVCLAEAGIMKRYIVARFANWVRERMMKRHWGFFCPHAFQTLKAYHWLICWKMTNSGSYEIKLLGSASNLEQMQRRIG